MKTFQDLSSAVKKAKEARQLYRLAQDQALPELLEEHSRHSYREAEIEAQYGTDIKTEHRLTEFWHRTNAWVRRTFAMNAESRRHETSLKRILDLHKIPEHEAQMAHSRMSAHNILDEMIADSEEETT